MASILCIFCILFCIFDAYYFAYYSAYSAYYHRCILCPFKLCILYNAYCAYCAYSGWKSHSQGFHCLLSLLLGRPSQGPAVPVPPPTTITTVCRWINTRVCASQQTQVFSETRLLSPLLHCSNRTSCPHRARLLTADVHLLLQPKMKLRRTFHVFLLFVCAKSLFQYYNFIYMLHLNDLKGPGCDRLRCFNTQVKNLWLMYNDVFIDVL